jgi:hypothetical protein
MNAENAISCKVPAAGARVAGLGTAAAVESLVLGLLALIWAYFSYGYIEDDAFIHLEFARSVASGAGFAFGGSVINGDTAPLWVLCIALLNTLNVGAIASAKIACAAGIALAVSGAWRLASDLPREGPAHALLPLAAVAVIVLNPYFVHWSFSGMEADAALGLSLWVVWAVFLGTLTLRRALFAAVLLALGPLLRPELLVFAALIAPALLWRSWRAAGTGSRLRHLAGVGALGILMLIPLCIWCWYALHAFGSVIPNTNAAKRGGALGEIAARLIQVYAMGFPVTLLLLPFVFVRGLWGRQTPSVIWALLLWPAACIAFYLANHTLVQTRYGLLSMPSMSIAVLWLLGRSVRPRIFAGAAATMLVASIAVVVVIVVPHVRNKEELRDKFTAVGSFINANIPAREPVAVMAIGQIEFESRHPLLDLGGITQPAVVPYLNDPPATLRWAKSRGARYLVAAGLPEPGAVPVFSVEMPYVGWTLRHARYRDREPFSVYRLP